MRRPCEDRRRRWPERVLGRVRLKRSSTYEDGTGRGANGQELGGSSREREVEIAPPVPGQPASVERTVGGSHHPGQHGRRRQIIGPAEGVEQGLERIRVRRNRVLDHPDPVGAARACLVERIPQRAREPFDRGGAPVRGAELRALHES